MDSGEAPPPVDPGTELAYDHAIATQRVNLDDLRALDGKVATMIALLGGAVAAYVVGARTDPERWVGGIFLAAAVATALLAYRIKDYQDAPRPDTFAEYTGYSPAVMKQQFLQAALEAWRANRDQLAIKGRLINVTFYLVGALAALAIAVRLFNLDARLPH